jgi:hypothetical protein
MQSEEQRLIDGLFRVCNKPKHKARHAMLPPRASLRNMFRLSLPLPTTWPKLS